MNIDDDSDETPTVTLVKTINTSAQPMRYRVVNAVKL